MGHTTNNDIRPDSAIACASCNAPLHGQYCSSCGEKKLDKHDRKISHIFEEFIHSFTHADSKFLRSLKYLLIKPGFLTSENIAGRRRRYSSPLSMFFIANVLYLLIGQIDAFNSKFVIVTQGQPYSESLTPQVQHKMQQRHLTIEELEKRYDEKSPHVAKLMLILYVFLVSLPVALLFISARHYYYDYFVFAMEYFSFILVAVMLLTPYLIVIAIAIMKQSRNVSIDINTPRMWAFGLLLLWTYLAIAARRVFKQKWWLTIIKSGLLVVCSVALCFVYRFVAFEVIMYLL